MRRTCTKMENFAKKQSSRQEVKQPIGEYIPFCNYECIDLCSKMSGFQVKRSRKRAFSVN